MEILICVSVIFKNVPFLLHPIGIRIFPGAVHQVVEQDFHIEAVSAADVFLNRIEINICVADILPATGRY